MSDVQILNGDCREMLKQLPDNSIQCCVTSPPYYGLRDYGVDGQIGLEQTPFEYIDELVSVFHEVKRVLKDDGTLWLNLGDSYSAHKDCKSISQSLAVGTQRENAHVIEKGKSRTRDSHMLKENGFKNKDLMGIPWRVAFALQADGWYLRSDIIWSKPNPMPESVTDRPTKAHEYMFLLTKSQKYYYDSEAVRELAAYDGRKDTMMKGSAKYLTSVVPDKKEHTMASSGHERWQTNEAGEHLRNRRSVWTIPTKPYKGAHFATFPYALVEPCVKAGCPIGGTVLDPFGGSGTVGQWCKNNGRNAILIELNPNYIPLIEDRINTVPKPSKPKKQVVEEVDYSGMDLDELEATLQDDEKSEYEGMLIESPYEVLDVVRKAYWLGKGVCV